MKEFGLSWPSSADASRAKSRLASIGIPPEEEEKNVKEPVSQWPSWLCGGLPPRSPSLPSATHLGTSVIPLKDTSGGLPLQRLDVEGEHEI